MLAHHLQRQGVFAALLEQVRFARRRFGRYDVIDFVAVLFGYAVSPERTLEAFYERLQPWARRVNDCMGQRCTRTGRDWRPLPGGLPPGGPYDPEISTLTGYMPYALNAGHAEQLWTIVEKLVEL